LLDECEDKENDHEDDEDEEEDEAEIARAPLALVASDDAEPDLADDSIDDMPGVVGRIDAARNDASIAVLFIGCGDERSSFDASIALARALAQRGRTIIVGADAEDESYDRLVVAAGEGRPAGLSDLAARETTFADAIHRDTGSRLHVMPSGAAEEGVDQEAPWVLEALARAYDFVVFATRSYERALSLSPSFDMILVGGNDDVAEAVRDELEEAGVEDVVLLEDAGFASASAA
jgi:Mrp family chromosome partitioning ATPase